MCLFFGMGFSLALVWLILGAACLWCRLDVYIYDYLLKRNLQTTAKAFMAEGKVAADPVGECPPLPRLCLNPFSVVQLVSED